MHWAEKALIWLLRGSAFLVLTALIPVVMPYEWMDAIHGRLGLGELPRAPIVGYLARSCSALYAYHGGLVLFVSFDVRRYLPVIRCLGWLAVAFGAVVLGIDWAVGLPLYWIVGEGPFVMALGAVILWFARRTESQGGVS